jgi:ubiquinol-cytochrome c reductase cytochrome c1 subunit
MKKILSGLAVLGFVLAGAAGTWAAEEEGHSAAEPTHFPIHKPEQQSWSVRHL